MNVQYSEYIPTEVASLKRNTIILKLYIVIFLKMKCVFEQYVLKMFPQVRIEQMIVAEPGAVLLYKISNLLKFYHHTIR